MDQAEKAPQTFHMVEIDPRVVSILESQPRTGPLGQFGSYGRPPTPTIAIGDTVAVSIFQAGSGPAFLAPRVAPGGGATPNPQPGQEVVLPEQVVGRDGEISVPYAGRVRVAGRTPLQVQATIEQRLTEQVVQPQAIVTVAKTASNTVTVSGEDVAGQRVPLSAGGDRLLDVIASAGGSRSPFYDTSVLLSRNGRTATIPMTSLVSQPLDNIYVWPGDVITIERTPKRFLVFGATSTNNQVPFGAPQLDLAQAVAKAGGLLDLRADPEGVFLFRFESPAVARALGLPRLANQRPGDSPVVYHLNLRQVDGYFLADSFAMKNNDLIYVANAPLTQVQKFFTTIGLITAPGLGAAAARP